MKLKKKVQKAIRKMVLEEYDHQDTVRDVYSGIMRDHYGDKCVGIQLVVKPGVSPKKLAKVMFHMQVPIARCLSKNGMDLPPFMLFRRIYASS